MSIKFNFNTQKKPAASEVEALAEYNAMKTLMDERGIEYNIVKQTDDDGKEIEGAQEIGYKRVPVNVEPVIPDLAAIMEASGGVKALEALIAKEAKKILKPKVEAGEDIPEEISAVQIIDSLSTSGRSGKVTPEALEAALEGMQQYLESIERPENAINAMLQGLGKNEKGTILAKAGVLKVWGDKSAVVRDYVRAAAEEFELPADVEAVFNAWDSKLSAYLTELEAEKDTLDMF